MLHFAFYLSLNLNIILSIIFKGLIVYLLQYKNILSFRGVENQLPLILSGNQFGSSGNAEHAFVDDFIDYPSYL